LQTARQEDFSAASEVAPSTMIYLTQLVFLHPGGEADFEAFEAVAIPGIARYGGTLHLRIRPDAGSVIQADGEVPYEVHLVSFPNADSFERFKTDEARRAVLHLKERSVRAMLLIQGEGA